LIVPSLLINDKVLLHTVLSCICYTGEDETGMNDGSILRLIRPWTGWASKLCT